MARHRKREAAYPVAKHTHAPSNLFDMAAGAAPLSLYDKVTTCQCHGRAALGAVCLLTSVAIFSAVKILAEDWTGRMSFVWASIGVACCCCGFLMCRCAYVKPLVPDVEVGLIAADAGKTSVVPDGSATVFAGMPPPPSLAGTAVPPLADPTGSPLGALGTWAAGGSPSGPLTSGGAAQLGLGNLAPAAGGPPPLAAPGQMLMPGTAQGGGLGAPPILAGSVPVFTPFVNPAPARGLVAAQALIQTKLASGHPYWYRDVANDLTNAWHAGTLDDTTIRLLQSNGFDFRGAHPPPDPVRLMDALRAAIAAAGPATGSAGSLMPVAPASLAPADGGHYHHQLPPGFQRAGLEIYQNMRASGAGSTREWLTTNFQGSRSGALWVDLWTAATTVDFIIGQASSQSEAVLIATLGSNDIVELSLRRLASYLYASRTKDLSGATHMLGVRPPGAQTDIAPVWLVDNVTQHSKAEFQRADRVARGTRNEVTINRRRGGPKGDKGGKGDGKSGGKAGNAAASPDA